MPISSCNTAITNKQFLNVTGKSAKTCEDAERRDKQILLASPALPILPSAPLPSKNINRSFSSISFIASNLNTEDAEISSHDVIPLQQTGENRGMVAARSPAERSKNPDRISLDRRGLTAFPNVAEESRLRLMSLQHNLISKIETAQFIPLTKLVFLDLYDNQIERLCSFEPLVNLRVLLLGKNRLKKIEGLTNLSKLEVLDFHGNQIVQVSGLDEMGLLKVLNLAGNNIKTIGSNDFHGLVSLRELNLRRNKIQKMLGFGELPHLQKLFLSNNDIQRIEDIGCLIKIQHLKEIAIDGNPLSLNPDCISFLVSYLPSLQTVSTVQINEQVRKAAMSWRTSKEQSNSAFLDLSTQVCVNVRREEVISNAKTNWEHLRFQSKKILANSNKVNSLKNEHVRSLPLQNSKKLETMKLKSLDKTKSKGFGSLTSINDSNNEKKFQLKSRSNSTDNLSTLDDTNRTNALEFKLPPILVPIINNINNRIMESTKVRSQLELVEGVESTDTSDFEISDNHEARGKRLVQSANRLLSRSDSLSRISTSNSRYDPFSEASRRCNATPTKVNCNQNLSKVDSSSSKTSSLDSSKSIFSDSSGSSLAVSDKSGQRDGRVKSAQMMKVVHYRSNRAATARAKHTNTVAPSPPPPIPTPTKEREQGGDFLIEITGRCLNIYGQGSLKFIDRPWDTIKANDVNTVKFNYAQFNGIALVLNKIKNRFPNVEHFLFKETNISHLGQLNALAEIQGLTSLQIDAEGNPVVFKNWKIYAIFRLAHWGLRSINGVEVTKEDIDFANKEYSGLVDVVLWSLPESLLQPLLQRLHLDRLRKQNAEQLSAKQFLFNSDPTLKNVVAKEALQWRRGQVTQEDLIWRHKGKLHISHLIEQTVSAIEKLQTLDKNWPNILYQIIRDTLKDYSDMDLYMKRCSRNLEEEI